MSNKMKILLVSVLFLGAASIIIYEKFVKPPVKETKKIPSTQPNLTTETDRVTFKNGQKESDSTEDDLIITIEQSKDNQPIEIYTPTEEREEPERIRTTPVKDKEKRKLDEKVNPEKYHSGEELDTKLTGTGEEETTETTKNAEKPLRLHTVAEGESLWTIAEKYYGNGSKFTHIYNANKDKILPGNLLRVKTVLVIPYLPESTSKTYGLNPQAEESVPATVKTYKVVKGDNLESIAKKFYGKATFANKIFEANRDKITSPNSLQIGTVLIIPDLDSDGVEFSLKTSKKEEIPEEFVGKEVYTVQQGDSLWTISQKKYGSSKYWEALWKANKNILPSANELKEGQIILIPSKSELEIAESSE